MYHFCTYFDSGFLTRGLVLYRSLREQCVSFELWVLCLDSECYRVLSHLRLENIHLLDLEDLERSDRLLVEAKQNRSLIEYYFTCTPALPQYIFERFPSVELLTYLDADLFFFGDPAPIYEEIGGHSIAIIAHRFPKDRLYFENHGKYNVGWISFRRDENALACLRWWREKCIEWCYDRVENGLFADQKYLDDWPNRFQNVVVLGHKGANLAPWNLANYAIQFRPNGIWVDDQALVFFHFHGLRQIKDWLYDPHLTIYKTRLSRTVKRGIYAPYIQALKEAEKLVPHWSQSRVSNIRQLQHCVWVWRIGSRLKKILRLSADLISGQLIVIAAGGIK